MQLERDTIKCKLCGAESFLVQKGHVGYSQGESYNIYECSGCTARFADPVRDATKLYNIIYSDITAIPGYVRYSEHANAVAVVKDPLLYLASVEECYWAVAKHLKELRKTEANDVVEIGSGLGYLTYAIAKAGFSTLGIDASSIAVDAATKRYGPYFKCADIEEYSCGHAATADLVVMTEVIEHIIDPISFLTAALKLLRPGGKLVVTTPNRSVYSPAAVWASELPPIHWWWLTEDSLSHLAARLGCAINFTDFTDFNAQKQRYIPSDIRDGREPRVPILDRDGKVMRPLRKRQRWSVLRKVAASRAVRRIYRHIMGGELLEAQSSTMCAEFAPIKR